MNKEYYFSNSPIIVVSTTLIDGSVNHKVGEGQITVDRVIGGGDSVVLSNCRRLAFVATQ